jgi:zinc transport system substrate-binding protein
VKNSPARALLAFSLLCLAPLPAHAAKVMVSIKPLYSLVAGVMGDTGRPELIVEGMQSPHGYQLKPSQVSAMQDADVIFYISPDLETFLAKPLANLPMGVQKVALAEQSGVELLNIRDLSGDKITSVPVRHDPHIWMSTANAKIMVGYIIHALSDMNPQNTTKYIQNGTNLMVRLQKLDTQLRQQMKPYKGGSYIAYHDAFQYFDHDYGLNAAAAITQDPEQEPGAKRLEQVRAIVKDKGIRCVFSEPEFNSRLIGTVVEGTGARTAVIDEIGGDIPDGSDQYFTLMHRTADAFAQCLTPLP